MEQTACVFTCMFVCVCIYSGYRSFIRDVLPDIFSQSVMPFHGFVVQLLSCVQLFATPRSAGDSGHLNNQCEASCPYIYVFFHCSQQCL